MDMLLKEVTLFEFFGDSRGLLFQKLRNTAEGAFLFESFFNCDTVI